MHLDHLREVKPLFKTISQCLTVIFGAALIALGFNLFLVPHQLLSGGVSGLAMLTGYFTNFQIGTLYFVYNIPLLIAGMFLLGKKFIGLSILNVAATTWLIAVIPVTPVATDPLLASVFGGVIVGLGSGISFRAGGSSGGFDILGSIITKYRDFPVGSVLVSLNALVIVAMGYMNGNWNLALYSMISIYLSGKVLDFVYISHIKVTLFIITNNTDDLLQKLLQLPRGVTLIKTEGAFSHKEKDMLMTVTTRYELAELREIIRKSDPGAFVNIVETLEVMGSFRRG
ncbi:YitT family protein [Paenibacillus shirakamiensis]|uniref:YitT family protein n=1 Tax=Paenibacillus shirakamiensis TaxID=1265935 RepID=UPI001AEA5FCE